MVSITIMVVIIMAAIKSIMLTTIAKKANIRIKTIYLVLKNKIKYYITIVKFYKKSADIIVKI